MLRERNRLVLLNGKEKHPLPADAVLLKDKEGEPALITYRALETAYVEVGVALYTRRVRRALGRRLDGPGAATILGVMVKGMAQSDGRAWYIPHLRGTAGAHIVRAASAFRPGLLR